MEFYQNKLVTQCRVMNVLTLFEPKFLFKFDLAPGVFVLLQFLWLRVNRKSCMWKFHEQHV